MGVEFYLFRPARPSLGIAELRSICGRAVEEWTADERSEVVDECVYCRRSEEDPLVDRPDEWEETTTFCRSGKHFRQSFVPGFAEFLTPHDLRDAGEEMLRDLFDIVLAEHVDDDFHDALDVECGLLWSPARHWLFPEPARRHASSLALLGAALARQVEAATGGVALYEIWLQLVMPRALALPKGEHRPRLPLFWHIIGRDEHGLADSDAVERLALTEAQSRGEEDTAGRPTCTLRIVPASPTTVRLTISVCASSWPSPVANTFSSPCRARRPLGSAAARARAAALWTEEAMVANRNVPISPARPWTIEEHVELAEAYLDGAARGECGHWSW